MLRIGDFIRGLCFIATLIAAMIAAYIGYTITISSMSAPQQAAGYALALCIAVIPYVFSRTIDKLIGK